MQFEIKILAEILLVSFFATRFLAYILWGKTATQRRPSVMNKLTREGFTILFLFLFVLAHFNIVYVNNVFSANETKWAGFFLGLWGIAGMWWVRVTRKHTWSRIGDGMCTLVTFGPYALCRHPYYLFVAHYLVGIGLALDSALMLLLTPVWFFLSLIQAEKEEKFLVQTLGLQWREYCQNVEMVPRGGDSLVANLRSL